MRRIYFLLTFLVLLLQGTQLHAVVWYTSTSEGKADPNDNAKKFKYNQSSGYGLKDTISPNTKYCRIYKLKANGNVDNADNFPDQSLRKRLAEAMGYKDPNYQNTQYYFLTKAQVDAVTELALRGGKVDANGNCTEVWSSILTLQGLQIFSNLRKLDISYNKTGGDLETQTGSLQYNYINPHYYQNNTELVDYLNLPLTDMEKANPTTKPLPAKYKEARRHYLSYLLLFFPHLEELNISGTAVEYLHVPGTTAKPKTLKRIIAKNCEQLRSLKANHTLLDSLNITGCTNLLTLEVHYSNLEHLDISTNLKLNSLDASYCKLNQILINTKDTTVNKEWYDSGTDTYKESGVKTTGTYPVLEKIVVRNNKLDWRSFQHLSGCTSLRLLSMQNNQFHRQPGHEGSQYDHEVTLDFSNIKTLEGVWCGNDTTWSPTKDGGQQLYWGNKIEKFVINKDPSMKTFECQHNNVQPGFDFTGKAEKLAFLDCSGNPYMTKLTFDTGTGQHDSLHTIYAYSCALTDSSNLTFTSIPNLKKLRLSNNTLSGIDLSNNPLVEDIYMNNCGMDSVNNLENLTNLKIFMANNNDLTNMDFSKLTKLETFQASQNKFTDLDLTAQTKLRTLLCDGQGGYADFTGRILRTLKLNSDSLTALKCDNNRLITLDLGNCPNLTYQGFIGATQRDVQDLRVFDHSKICVELPNGALGFGDANEDPLNYFYTWEEAKTEGGHVSNFDLGHSDVIEREGKQWLVIYDIEKGSKKQDANFYKNTIAYCYYLWGAWNDGAAGTVNESGEPDEALGKSKYFAEQNRKIATTDYNISTKGNGIEINVNPDRLNNNIQVYTYPYVMYVNPASQDLYAQSEGRDVNNFYSGTIILPYDAIVPEGTTAYIAKNIRIAKDEIYTTEHDGEKKVVEDQMLLIPLEPGYEDDDPNTDEEDVVIPAFTAVYVKADTENGLFGFDRKELKGYTSEHLAKVRNENNELVAVSEVKNILEGNVIKDGTGKDSAIVDLVLGASDYKKYLTLGRGVVSNITYERDPSTGKISDQSFVQNQSRIGFWPFTGSKIPAHRAFIRAAQLDSAVVEQGPAATSGLLFKFLDNDNDNINTTTSIQSSRLNALTKEGWYTISGIRLKGRPTTKGVYIHNGRKEVIE